MTKIFAIATILFLITSEIVKRLSLGEVELRQANLAMYFAFLFPIYFMVLRRSFSVDVIVALILSGLAAGISVIAMDAPGVGLAIWLICLCLSIWCDRKAAKAQS